MNLIAALRAAGLSAEQIVETLEHMENEKTARRREQNRINKRNQRSRHQISADVADSADRHIDKKDPSSSSSSEKKKERKKVSIPDAWLPNAVGLELARKQGWDEHKIKLEIHRFSDHAQQHNRQYADWQAAWRNWVTSPFQQRGNKNGAGNGVMEALDRAIDRAGGGEVQGSFEMRDVTPRRG